MFSCCGSTCAEEKEERGVCTVGFRLGQCVEHAVEWASCAADGSGLRGGEKERLMADARSEREKKRASQDR